VCNAAKTCSYLPPNCMRVMDERANDVDFLRNFRFGLINRIFNFPFRTVTSVPNHSPSLLLVTH